ncbi:hypothetical protein D3C76_1279230 [compost metagenome]
MGQLLQAFKKSGRGCIPPLVIIGADIGFRIRSRVFHQCRPARIAQLGSAAVESVTGHVEDHGGRVNAFERQELNQVLANDQLVDGALVLAHLPEVDTGRSRDNGGVRRHLVVINRPALVAGVHLGEPACSRRAGESLGQQRDRFWGLLELLCAHVAAVRAVVGDRLVFLT